MPHTPDNIIQEQDVSTSGLNTDFGGADLYRFGENFVYVLEGQPVWAMDTFGRQIDVPSNFSVNAASRVFAGGPTPQENTTKIPGISDAPPLTTGSGSTGAETAIRNTVAEGYRNAGFGTTGAITGGSRSGARALQDEPRDEGGGGFGDDFGDGGGRDFGGTGGDYGGPHGYIGPHFFDEEQRRQFTGRSTGFSDLILKGQRATLGSPYRDTVSQQAARLVDVPGLFPSGGDVTADLAVRNVGANAFGRQASVRREQLGRERGNQFFSLVNQGQQNQDQFQANLLAIMSGDKEALARLQESARQFDSSQKASLRNSLINLGIGIGAPILFDLLGVGNSNQPSGGIPGGRPPYTPNFKPPVLQVPTFGGFGGGFGGGNNNPGQTVLYSGG